VLQFDAKVEERVLTIEVLHHRETASTSNSLELGGLSMTNYDLRCLAIGLQDNLTVKSLNISHNCLTEKGIETVIDCLSKNSSIKELDISHNEISIVSIKKIIAVKPSLIKLDVSGIRLNVTGSQMVSSAIEDNSTLEELNMSYCSLNGDGAEFIAQALINNSLLKKLDLFANKIADDGAIAICKCLINNSTLQHLILSYSKITDSGLEKMAQAITVGTNFSQLDISGNRITSEGILTFLRTIQTNTALKLKTFFCQVNSVTKSGIVGITNFIKELNTSLEIHTSWNDTDIDHTVAAITTRYCSFQINSSSQITDDSSDCLKWPLYMIKDTDYAMELLSRCLQDNSSLRELHLLWFNMVTSERARKIAEILKFNTVLQKLDISHQNICEDGAKAIGDGLKNNNTLQELIMAGTKLTDQGITTLMNALELNSGLKKLDLSDKFLASLVATNAISNYLHDNTSLQVLNLSSSRITNGLSELMRGLFKNTSLHKLALSTNYFHDMGDIICTFLKENKTVLELDVSNCINLRKMDFKEFYEGLTENKTLQSLNISRNNLYNSGLTCLAECLQKNCTLKQLDLSDNEIKIWESNHKQFCTKICQLCKSLQHLNISNNRIFFDKSKAESNFLSNNNTLLMLAMSNCDISSSGTVLIAEVKVNTTLKILDTSHNEIYDVGIINIANSLKHNNSMEELNLSSTNMTSSGATQIADTLYVNTALRELNISHNTLESNGVAAMAECLKKNFTLQKLDVSCCNITSITVSMFTDAIKVNKGLRTFDLSENALLNDTFEFNITVLDAMHFNKHITFLGLPVEYKHHAIVRDKLKALNDERKV